MPSTDAAYLAEISRLRRLLDEAGIDWREGALRLPDDSSTPSPFPNATGNSAHLSVPQKIALFRSLFRGREDVYAVRWQSRQGKAGYSPACAHEWQPGICGKPKIKCSACSARQFLPLTDEVIYRHLSGAHTVGMYPLRADESCFFLAMDFDDGDWQADAAAVVETCKALDLPVAVEVSRSGQGAHLWWFFAEPLSAALARQLGAALISETCRRTRQLSLHSYDRLFPNQDTMPKGGLGNLIALPLQKEARAHGGSVFVDEYFQPVADQWAFLAGIYRLTRETVKSLLLSLGGGQQVLDVAFIEAEDLAEPWRPRTAAPLLSPQDCPPRIAMIFAQQIFIDKQHLPQALRNRLIRLAAFANPEFYQAQALRLPVWNKPRVIGCAENFPQHIALPRGCLDAVLDLLTTHHIEPIIEDKRQRGTSLALRFTGTLREAQQAAVDAMLAHDIGILCAPTAFGKTVTAAALIAARQTSTLILVHRAELLRQWQQRLRDFLDVDEASIGALGAGKNTLNGQLDIALLQSLARREDLPECLAAYGHIVVDECHHISAHSFERILKLAPARHVLGLTATPTRRDGQQPIVLMQCGKIRHHARLQDHASLQRHIIFRPTDLPPLDGNIQALFRHLVHHEARNRQIIDDVQVFYQQGGKILLLTEQSKHLFLLADGLADTPNLFILHGKLGKKRRQAVLDALQQLPDDAPRILLATGRLIGEGFDHPPLDTLFLAMPVSWQGTLQQYAGRLHRDSPGKTIIRAYDYVDTALPTLQRMAEKRRKAWLKMGYRAPDLLADG
ncbi:MAG: DEAD/DEAH box helicase family protein [Cardiobacteriaceae bacterium]|nr:DEAD/DEAH box helicase family protein [Cardiobacteriaceae bacterium]